MTGPTTHPPVAPETLATHACFGGTQGFYRHASSACAGPMRFGVYLPPAARSGRCPVVFYLAGLTCTEETFAIKAGAQRVAASSPPTQNSYGLPTGSPLQLPAHRPGVPAERAA